MNYRFMKFMLSMMIIGLIVCISAFGMDAFQKFYRPIKQEVIEVVENTGAIIEKKEDVSTPQIIETRIDNVEGSFANNVEYQSASSSKHYFYEQLDSYAKKIYDGMDANIDNMKTGTYNIEYGDAFDSVLDQENSQSLLKGYYQSAMEAFIYDNPQVFFLDSTKMYLNIDTTVTGSKKTYNVYLASDEGSNYFADGFYSAEQVNNAYVELEQVKNEILSNISGNTKDRIKQIHDYLVDSINYDQTFSRKNAYNLYGALIDRECVCEGYAKAFKYLLDEVGIENIIVIGNGTNSKGETENHAWNYVLLDGNWYAVDVTWDDPIIQGWGIAIPSSYKYKFFLKGAETMNVDHITNGQFTENGKVFHYPNLSNSDY